MKLIIKAIAERYSIVEGLKRELPDVEVVWDRERSPIETTLRALEPVGDDSSIQFEDDIRLTANFLEKAKLVIEEVKAKHGDIPISFFSMRPKDLTIGSRLEKGRIYCMAQATYFPKGMCKDMLEWSKTDQPDWEYIGRAPDFFYQKYFQTHKVDYWIAVPSLVDHLPIKSAIQVGRSTKRQSLTFMVK